MNKFLAEKIIKHEIELGLLDSKLSAVMEKTNELVDDDLDKYPTVDIQFAKFTESIVDQRERDLIYVSNFFHTAYKSLHITVQVMKEELNIYTLDIVKNVYQALLRLGQVELLTTGLTTKTIKKYLR